MNTRDKLIEIARGKIGYVEGKDATSGNITYFGQWFGLDRVAWCGIFVSWAYYMIGKPLGNIGFLKGFAGCGTAVAHFIELEKKEPGRWITKNPKKGDIVFFDFDGNGSWDHTGLFDYWIDEIKGTFETVEGNTSDKNATNGGMVLDRIRYSKGKTKVLFVNFLG